MQLTEFTRTEFFPVSPELLYETWLDSQGHSNMTGGEAEIMPKTDTDFAAWNGYIKGKILALDVHKEIQMSWRTSEFKETDEDSLVTLKLKPKNNGSELTLIHQNIPPGQPDYNIGWTEHYIKPMKEYFAD